MGVGTALNNHPPPAAAAAQKPEQPSSRGWSRLLLPSVTDLLFIVLLFSLTAGVLAPRLLGDAGIGWHIRNGELILQNHSITRTDPFSSTMGGHPWFAWEWLYDVIIASVHHWLGLNGIVFFTALLIAATFALTLRMTIDRGAALPVAVVLVVLAVSASTIHIFVRPHVVSWLLALVWFHILDSAESQRGQARLYWLPVITLLWANLHGGFLLGLALLGLYLVAAGVEYLKLKDAATRSHLKHLEIVAVLSVLAGLVNPYGYKLYVHLYQYLSNRFLMNQIEEFQSPNFHGIAQQCFALLLLIAVFALAIKREKLRPSRLLVLVFAVYSGLYASRNLPVSSILLTLIVAPVLSRGLGESADSPSVLPGLRKLFAGFRSFASRMDAMELRLRGHLWALAALALGFWISVHGGNLGAQAVMNAQFSAKRFPVRAVDTLAARGIQDPVFCPDYWGGYIIYRLYPQSRVVIDDRHDLYGESFLKEYLKTIHADPGWDGFLEHYRVNLVLTPSESPLANILKETRQWELVYDDKQAAVFERRAQS